MESSNCEEQRTAKAKKGTAISPARSTLSRSSAPTRFVLRSEKDLERSTQQRGRRLSATSASAYQNEDFQSTPTSSTLGDSSFGVQSLEETIGSTFSSTENILSRTTSNDVGETDSIAGDRVSDAHDSANVNIGRKRKAGNRVHPTILATGQRIISSERVPQVSTSPVSTSQSPLYKPSLRRGSNTSSIHLESQPLTPLRFSPHPESAPSSTPRTGSPKSFRLSDEDSADETNSQAITSSCGDEDERHLELPPQLVMPSLSVPLRRPFTETGRRIGRSRIMILGRSGVGKTGFINNLYRCEHIVHMDSVYNAVPQSSVFNTFTELKPTSGFIEIQASTRPYPSWWTDFESRRMLLRRKSIGEGVLERNLTFVDTPGLEDDDQINKVMNYVNLALRRTANVASMNDIDLVSLLGGEGGVQIDAAVYLFDPTLSESSDPSHVGLTSAHQELLRFLSKWTNLIPVISRSDTVTPDTLELRKTQIAHMLELINAEPYDSVGSLSHDNSTSFKPFAISVTAGEDSEIDASVLMASQYLPPLLPSDFNTLVHHLLDPDNIARMRHLSATKFVMWRKENLGYHISLRDNTGPESSFWRSQSPGVTSSGSIVDEHSKILVPHSSSSYYRSASPATSDISGSHALARLSQHAQPSEPFRQVRLAKWAQDLQRSLANESRKYAQLYHPGRPAECPGDPDPDRKAVALARPPRGRLGGDLGVIDPRDPLGILAVGRKGLLVLQVVGGCGLVGAVAYWVMRNWMDVQDFLGWQAATTTTMSAAAVPAPGTGARGSVLGWFDEQYLRGFFGWR